MVFGYLLGENVFASGLGLFKLWNLFLIWVHLDRLEQCNFDSACGLLAERIGIDTEALPLLFSSSLAHLDHKVSFAHCGLKTLEAFAWMRGIVKRCKLKNL